MADQHTSGWDLRRSLASPGLRFAGALLCSAVALLIWFLWPEIHDDPFPVFIAAVIVSARFFGFGPSLLCTASSACALDYFALGTPSSFRLSEHNFAELCVFVAVSVLTAGLARQRSRAEQNAGEARERMASIVESSEDAILSTTPEGVITSWNRGAEELYGYTAKEAVGRHVSLIAPPERYFEITNHTAKLKRGERVESLQTERMRKDGTRVSVMLSISPVRDEEGKVVGSSAIGRDITAQIRAEEMLRRNERLATAGRLAASIAHEINNPLEAVTNLLYLAGHNEERRDEYLRLAEQEVQRIANIAQQTLGFVRETTSPVIIDVSEVLNQVLQLYDWKLKEKHIELRCEFQAVPAIQGFPGELRQLFSNLIINSIDAMRNGGSLHVRLTGGRDWTQSRRHGVRVTIADSGTGIEPSQLPRIFDPFYTTKKDMGTGLGLWVTYGIVQKHSGQIRVRSSTGPGPTGTVFSIFLPQPEEKIAPLQQITQPIQAHT